MSALTALVWFGIVATRPVAMPCPMGGHASMEHAAMEHAAMEHAAMERDATSDLPTESENSRHACDCLAHCCATATALLYSDVPAAATIALHADSAVVQAYTSYLPVWVDYVLPFAIAPPASAHS